MKKTVIKMRSESNVVIESMRICSYTNCNVMLNATQKRFCSYKCRNFVLSPSNKGGAPQKYRSEFSTTKFKEYLELCEEGNKPTLIPVNNSYVVLNNAKLPSKIDYALFLGVSSESLRNWSKKYQDFSDTMEMLMGAQQTFLINYGLSGRYKPNLAALMLKINHGFRIPKQVDSQHKVLGVVKNFYKRVDELEQETNGNRTL